MKNTIPTDEEIEKETREFIVKQIALPQNTLDFIVRVQTDGAIWMKQELVKLGLLDDDQKRKLLIDFGKEMQSIGLNELDSIEKTVDIYLGNK